MTISEYQKICNETHMDSEVKQRILTEILEQTKLETEEAKLQDAKEQEVTERKAEILETEEVPEMTQIQGHKRFRGKKRVVLVAVACLLIGSVTTLAVERNVKSRPHLQQKVYMDEESDVIVLSDTKPEDWIYENMGNQEEESGENEEASAEEFTEGTEIYYETLEEAMIELNISPLLPDTTEKDWSVTDFEVSVLHCEEEEYICYEDTYFMDIIYGNEEGDGQQIELDLQVDHCVVDDRYSYSKWAVAFEKQEGMENVRTYCNPEGRSFVLYESESSEDGEYCTYVQFSYSDRYWINELIRQKAVDFYSCVIECRGMSDTEIYDMLDQLVVYELAY